MLRIEQIEQTEVFKNIANQTQQMIILKKSNREAIRLGFEISKNTSFNNWVQIYHPNLTIQRIVEELHNTLNQ